MSEMCIKLKASRLIILDLLIAYQGNQMATVHREILIFVNSHGINSIWQKGTAIPHGINRKTFLCVSKPVTWYESNSPESSTTLSLCYLLEY